MIERVGLPQESGTFTVRSGEEERTFEDVSFAYGPDHELMVQRAGATVAVFRWWDSIFENA